MSGRRGIAFVEYKTEAGAIRAKESTAGMTLGDEGRDGAYLATLTRKDRVFEEQSSKLAATETRVKDLGYGLTQLKAEVASCPETMFCSRAIPPPRPRVPPRAYLCGGPR